MMKHRRSPSRLLLKQSLAATLFTALLHHSHKSSLPTLFVNGLKLTSLHSCTPWLWSASNHQKVQATKPKIVDADATSLQQGPASSSPQYNSAESKSNSNIGAAYGVDCSFPTQHSAVKNDANSPFDSMERQNYYNEFMKECRDKLHPAEYLCDESEKARIETNLLQPAKMKNYTELGFQKVSTPPKLQEELTKFFPANAGTSAPPEKWGAHNGFHTSTSQDTAITYMNHWSSYSQLINIDDEQYNPSGERLRTLIWEEAKPVLEQWSGVELSPSSVYGIRVWSNNAVVPPHLEADPLLISAVIRVDESLEDPWVIEMIGHDGMAYNVTLEAGEMLLYEGASVIHGRPFPMKGLFSSDVFVHFEPIGNYLTVQSQDENLEDLYQQAMSRARMAKNLDIKNSAMIQLTLHPNYIHQDSSVAKRWRQTHKKSQLKIPLDTSNLNVHTAASTGDLEALMQIEESNPGSIHKVDENGWTALHEAVRSEQIEVMKYLLGKGLDINQRTHHGEGGSPLWWAKYYHGKDSKTVKFLESRGAKDLAPKKEMKV